MVGNILDDYRDWFGTDEWRFAMDEISKSNMLPYPVSSRTTIREASEMLRDHRDLPLGIAMDIPSPIIIYDEEERKFIPLTLVHIDSHLPSPQGDGGSVESKLKKFLKTAEGKQLLNSSRYSGEPIHPLSFNDEVGKLLEIPNGDVVATYDEYDSGFRFDKIQRLDME